MTQDQFMGLLRQALPILGGIAVALGYLTTDQVARTTQIILQIAGPLATIAGIVWSWIANNKSSIVQAAAGMPEARVSGNVITLTDNALIHAAHQGARKKQAA